MWWEGTGWTCGGTCGSACRSTWFRRRLSGSPPCRSPPTARLTAWFDAATIERLIGQFETLVAAALRTPEQPMAELPLLSPAEAQQLRDWNATNTLYGSAERCLHELVEEQAGRTPAAPAVRAATAVLT